MSSSAPGAPSNEGRSAFRNVQTDLMIPCSMLAIFFDLAIAHHELGLRTKLAGEDPCMMFPQAQGSPSRAVLEMAPDHIYDIEPPTKLTARDGYQQQAKSRGKDEAFQLKPRRTSFLSRQVCHHACLACRPNALFHYSESLSGRSRCGADAPWRLGRRGRSPLHLRKG